MIANPNDGNSPRVEVATPMIDVSAGGLITATTEQEKGYVSGGTKSATQQLTTQGAKTVTPTTTNQTAVASGRYTTGDVVVSGDANLVPENIAKGVSIFGVTGTHLGGGGGVEIQTINVTPASSGKFYAYETTVSMEGRQNILAYTDTGIENLAVIGFALGGVNYYSLAYGTDTIEISVNGDTATISGPRGSQGVFTIAYCVF